MIPEWKEINAKDKYLIQSLGNLTLTTLNPEMSNKTFDKKRKIGFDLSGLELNKYFANPDLIEWNGKEIRKRGERLFNLAIKIWQDISSVRRDKQESEGEPIKDLDIGQLFNDNGKDDTPLKIKRVIFGKYEIDGKTYLGKKLRKTNEDDLPPAYKMPGGNFYDEVMLAMYQEHGGTFENTPLGNDVGLQHTEKEENGTCLLALFREEDHVRFVVPYSVSKKHQWFIYQTDYRKMWENIKRAAEETETAEMLRIVFAE